MLACVDGVFKFNNTLTDMVIDIDKNTPSKVSEVICVKCGKRWLAVRFEETLLKDLECPNCGKGYVIETGEEINKDEEYGKEFRQV